MSALVNCQKCGTIKMEDCPCSACLDGVDVDAANRRVAHEPRKTPAWGIPRRDK